MYTQLGTVNVNAKHHLRLKSVLHKTQNGEYPIEIIILHCTRSVLHIIYLVSFLANWRLKDQNDFLIVIYNFQYTIFQDSLALCFKMQ